MKFPSVDEIVDDAILRSRSWADAQGLPQPLTRQPMSWYVQERAASTQGRQRAGKAHRLKAKSRPSKKQSPK